MRAQKVSLRRFVTGSTCVLVLMLVSQIAAAAPNETLIIELAPGVYFRKAQTMPFTGCNQGWVEFKDFVLVIDANFPGQVKEILKEIRARTEKPVRFVFDTHYHGDHADGNMKYTEIGAVPIANERSKSLFESKGRSGFEQAQAGDRKEEYSGLVYAEPSLYFGDKLVIDDGTQRVELLYFGHAHTLGDAMAWLPEHGILFTGDACVNGAFNYMGDSNTESWISVLTAAQELPCKTVAPGHGELSDKELLEKQKRYFIELRSEVKKGIDKGRDLMEIKKTIRIPFYKEWTGTDAQQNVDNIEHVFKELTGGIPAPDKR